MEKESAAARAEDQASRAGKTPTQKKKKGVSIFALPEKKPIISDENALKQVMQLVVRYEIDMESKSKKEKKGFEEILMKIKSDIMHGYLEVFTEDSKLKVRQTIENPSKDATVKEIIYGEMTFEDHEAMSDGEGINTQTKMRELAVSMCENHEFPENIIKSLSSADAKRLQNLVLVFL